MSATCEKCSGTGQLPGSTSLDCASCDIAMIRVGLETWATENGIVADEDELWAIFKYGQSVAIEAAAKVCEALTEEELETPDGNRVRAVVTQYDCIDAIRALK